MQDDSDFLLDKRLVRASFDQAAATYDEAAALQREVGARMVERLELIRIRPQVILDLGCGTGRITAALLKRYPRTFAVGLDISAAMLHRARKQAPWFRKLHCVCGDAEALPLRDASCDLLFSNLTLQWCPDLDRAIGEFHRVLRPGGLLMFSTLGPDTLIELRRSWSAVDGFNHVNAFVDMHDIGDALLRARLTDPVMDAERITLTYRDVFGLMRDLKTLGAHNVSRGRARGLTGKGRLGGMRAAYEGFRRDGLLPASYEVVYGHAWAPEAAQMGRRDDASAVFPLNRLRRGGPTTRV